MAHTTSIGRCITLRRRPTLRGTRLHRLPPAFNANDSKARRSRFSIIDSLRKSVPSSLSINAAEWITIIGKHGWLSLSNSRAAAVVYLRDHECTTFVQWPAHGQSNHKRPIAVCLWQRICPTVPSSISSAELWYAKCSKQCSGTISSYRCQEPTQQCASKRTDSRDVLPIRFVFRCNYTSWRGCQWPRNQSPLLPYSATTKHQLLSLQRPGTILPERRHASDGCR